MVGERQTRLAIEDVLSDSQVCHVVKKCVGESDASWQLVRGELRPAAEGIAGFLGDHFRLALTVRTDGRLLTIPLFVKSMPLNNSPKAEFIDQHNFFRKEMMIFKLIEEMDTGGSNPWCARSVLCDESRLVMHDLAPQGYSTCDQRRPMSAAHVRAALAAVARFHAATTGRDTRRARALGRPYSLLEDYGDVLAEQVFKDTPWLRAGAKLTKNLINTFSEKYKDAIPDLEEKLLKQFLEACDDLVESKDSLNVVLHKDLWVNNIMFKYENGEPTNAILLDFQCVRYAPPTFDVMMLLYLTTSRDFREQHEREMFLHYFKAFMDSIDADTKVRVEGLGYDCEEFLRQAESSRRFGLLGAIMIFPYVLLEPTKARELFDDPATFQKYTNEDRSEPVLAQARCCPDYRRRQLEACEEFIERFLP